MKDECKQPLKEEGRISLSTTEMEQSASQHKDAVSRSECTIAISATTHTLGLHVHVVNMTCPGLPSTSSPIKTDHNHTCLTLFLSGLFFPLPSYFLTWPIPSSSSSFTYFSCKVSFSLLYYPVDLLLLFFSVFLLQVCSDMQICAAVRVPSSGHTHKQHTK